MKKELRSYQLDLSKKAVDILREKKIVYLAMEVRLGKTLTALNTCELYGAKSVLFVTKKKAISSIESDFASMPFSFDLAVINTESIHKVVGQFDVIISDENHKYGSFPKPSKGAKEFKQRYSHLPLIFLSGTPHPESYSQIYHQFWISKHTPFHQYPSFYKWASTFVNVTTKHLGYGMIKDYKDAKKELIEAVIKPYMITYTQKEAGFSSTINEKIIYVDMKESTYALIKRLEKDLIVQGKHEVIIGDTSVKLMSKLHQLYSGTIKFESGATAVLDYSKAIRIYTMFKSRQIAIFYKFKAELDALEFIFGDTLTTDLDEFNTTDKSIAYQIVSGREGVNLSRASSLVYYNIDFSAVSYWQSRDRLTTINRLENNVYWFFAKNGIEDKIYKAVMNKKNYTLNVFKNDFRK
jgi:hypothetical protein